MDIPRLNGVIKQGFRWLMPKPERTNNALATGKKLSGR